MLSVAGASAMTTAVNLAPEAFLAWVAGETQLDRSALSVTLVAGDASPRRYFRVQTHAAGKAASSIIAVLSPPSEKNEAFLFIRELFEANGIIVPRLVSADPDAGFFLLEDFGDTLLLDALRQDQASRWYPQALDILAQQRLIDQGEAHLPPYDEALLVEEMDLFPEWFLKGLLELPDSEMAQAGLEAVWERLVRNALAQPQVVVHRDFHSRNLMCLADGALGVIDFQDAVIGPITYDLVSLLKDCYVVWPRDIQLAWLRSAYDGLAEHHFATGASFTDFVGWFDLMGLQRHIKVLGIFARLYLRDDKPQYLNDLPRVLAYVLAALNLYRDTEPALAHFADWFEAELMPIASTQSWFTAE